MSAWTWILIALCAAAVVLAVAGMLFTLLAALRVRRRIDDMQNNPLLLTLEMLQIQAARLSRTAAQAGPLIERMRLAIAEIRQAPANAGLTEAQASLRWTGAQIQALLRDLS